MIHSIPGMIVSLWVGQVSESNVIFFRTYSSIMHQPSVE